MVNHHRLMTEWDWALWVSLADAWNTFPRILSSGVVSLLCQMYLVAIGENYHVGPGVMFLPLCARWSHLLLRRLSSLDWPGHLQREGCRCLATVCKLRGGVWIRWFLYMLFFWLIIHDFKYMSFIRNARKYGFHTQTIFCIRVIPMIHGSEREL